MIQVVKDIVESKNFPKLVDFLKSSSAILIACYVIYRLFGVLDTFPGKLDTIISKLETCAAHASRIALSKE